MKKAVITTTVALVFLLSAGTGIKARQPEQNVPKISSMVLVPIPQPPIEGQEVENHVEVDFKVEMPEMASQAVITLKKRNTNEVLKTLTVDFIEESGVIKYVYNNRKRALKRNYAAVLLLVGQETFENITAEAYIIDKSGNESEKAFF